MKYFSYLILHKKNKTVCFQCVDGNVMSKLNECFETQQKLAAENAQMAQMR